LFMSLTTDSTAFSLRVTDGEMEKTIFDPFRSYGCKAQLANIADGANYYFVHRFDASGNEVVDSNYPLKFHESEFWFKCVFAYYSTGSLYVGVAAWDDLPESGGVELGRTNVVPIFYDLSYQYLWFTLETEVIAIGEVKINAVPTDPIKNEDTRLYSFMNLNPTGNIDSQGDATFNYISDSFVQTPVPYFTMRIPFPGVWYVGLYSSWNGLYGNSLYEQGIGTGQGLFMPRYPRGGSTTFQPLALVVPFEDGSVPEIAAGFNGEVVYLDPIPGDLRAPLKHSTWKLYHGGMISLPLNLATESNGYPSIVPAAIELDLDPRITPRCADVLWGTGCVASNVTAEVVDCQAACWRVQIASGASQYSYLNQVVQIGFEIASAGSFVSSARLRVLKQLPSNSLQNWQTVSIEVEELTPLPLPARLLNSLTFGSWRDFCPWDRSLAFSNMQRLGYTVVPRDGMHYLDPRTEFGRSQMETKADREADPMWVEGMGYGPEHSMFYRGLWDGNGVFSVLKQTNYNMESLLGSFGLTSEQLAVETAKYRQAIDYYVAAGDGSLDLAYDGVFYQRDLESLFEVVNYTQPELLSLDCESWGYYSWGDKVPLSQNAQDIRLPGESNPALARRIADRVALDIADAAARGRPDTLLTMYDARAEDNRGYQQFRHSSFAAAGIATTPSHYGHQTSTALLSFLLRKEKKAIPTSPILPWLTYGWSGASPNDQIFEVFAHLFATGMRGFSQWSNFHIDDNRFHFALREVVGVLSSREIEAIVVDGRLAYTDFSQVTAAVLDAMELNGRFCALQ